MYVIVLFKLGSRPESADISREHEAFIDALIRRNQILLGGPWDPAAGPFRAAYLLRCASLEEARAITLADPVFRDHVYEAEIVEWSLVGINPQAIDLGVVLTPDQLGNEPAP
jgi:uncharacterized protein YciI